MKKSTLYSIICGSCLLASTGLTLIANGIDNANTNANTNTNTNTSTIATTATVDSTPQTFSRDETVYVITDHSGNQVKSFVNNTINHSDEPIPVDLHISYSLDSKAISGAELAGKSGHVKLTYSFDATKSYGNKKIPFLAVTGLLLDAHKFTNLTVTNGKIISESSDHHILAGYTLAGINEDLGLDLLSNSFSFEADVTDFTLGTTYTFATSEIFADLDTSKLNSVDSIINSINQLGSGLDQIIDGSHSLTAGLDSASAGAKALQSGLNTLSSGAHTLAQGTADLATGAHALTDGANQLKDGLNQVVAVDDQILSQIAIITNQAVTKCTDLAIQLDRIISAIERISPRTAAELTALKAQLEQQVITTYNNAYDKVITYTNGIQALSDGANQLAAGLTELSTGADSIKDGANQLASGATELSLGSNTLVNGLDQLATGSHSLNSGLITFKEQGISKLVNFANNDLANLVSNLRSTVNAAKSYHSYSNSTAKSVKFIFKTPSI